MRITIAVVLVLAVGTPARAQYLACVNLDRVNSRLVGRVVDFTHNHGADRRLYSPILGRPRDLYVYLPPGYDPRVAYPLLVYFHMAEVDEHYFVGSPMLRNLDAMILRGEVPPVVVACPDGTYGGRDLLCETHSFYVNGLGGRFEDHVFQEVIPFLESHYTLRPGREARALLGTSAGAFGAMSLAIRHRDTIGAVATMAGPLNLRYSNVCCDYFEDFDPARYRWKTRYDPHEVINISYCGLRKVHARRFISPVFGEGDEAVARIIAVNPADLLFSTDLRPGQLAMYVHYAGRDEWNFDAQNLSFLWLASRKGVVPDVGVDPDANHGVRYFNDNIPVTFLWLGRTLAPPVAVAAPGS
jgi:hypothetical protein